MKKVLDMTYAERYDNTIKVLKRNNETKGYIVIKDE